MKLNSETINIRPLNEDDIPMIVSNFEKHHWPKPTSTFQTYFAEQHQNLRHVWLAFYQTEFAGYVTLSRDSSYLPFRQHHIPEIMDLNVLPPYRRKGIASKLLDLAEKEAIVSLRSGKIASRE